MWYNLGRWYRESVLQRVAVLIDRFFLCPFYI
nr:MAG TPA: hypothetical protein [Caudoviricetes sp.]